MPEPVHGRCCSIDDVYDARRVAESLGIPYYVVNHQDRFERDVIRPFVDEYLVRAHAHSLQPVQQPLEVRPVTPVARQIGADADATGHYARMNLTIRVGAGC